MNPSKFTKDLEIDKYNLDEALVKQPQLYMEWALLSCQATEDKDNAKKDLDLVKARVETKIRKNYKRYGIEKLTEPLVKALIILKPKVQRYEATYLQAAHEERALIKMEKAFSHRKSSLEGLVQLDLRLHFNEPKIPQQRKEDNEKKNQRRKASTLKNLKKSYRSRRI
jgi:hypothetical protein